MKTVINISMEGKYIHILKTMYDKPTTNIILNDKKLKSFKIRNKTRMPTLTTFIEHSTGSTSQNS